MYQISVMAGLALGGLAMFLLAFAWARRGRARALIKAERRAGAAAAAPEPMVRRVELRLDEIEARLEARIEALAAAGSPEDRLQAMAGSLVGLIRDKNATLETALAGLDQLRARLRALEQMGDLAEARGLFERLEARIDEIRTTQAAAAAAVEERLAGLKSQAEAPRVAPLAAPLAAVTEQFGRLYAQKDAGVAAMLARLAPVEARLAELEADRAAETAGEAAAREARARLEARLEALREVQDAGQRDIAALKAEVAAAAGPVTAIAERLGGLHAQKEALAETLMARLAALEEALAGRDPQAALDRFAERLEAVQGRLSLLEAPGESPFAAISEQLTRLYAQKDATVETVFARLAPLEARLAAIEQSLAARDPRAELDRFVERLEATRARLDVLETPGANPFAEISEQLTRLYAQKDATVETVFARLAPLEERLAEMETGLAARDPQAALDRFAERLEAAQAARAAAEAGIRDRVAALETPGENPFAAISEQLTRLYAQKDATVETVFARLAPLEARLASLEEGLAARDPQAALDRFAERLEAAQAAREAAEAGIRDRVAALETPGENPFAEISEQLTRLYAQKDATVETVFARLAPLEARLAGIEQGLAQSLPRLAALEAEDPRVALNDLAAVLGARMEALRATQGAAAARIETLRETLGETLGEAVAAQPFAAISEQLTRLYAQKDAGVAAVIDRFAPLEARLAELEARPSDADEAAARAEAQAIATQMIAARAAAEQTELFANRLALLEMSLPRLTASQAEMARALGRQAAGPTPKPMGQPTGEPAPEPEIVPETTPAAAGRDAAAADLDAIRDMPRVVSLHHK